MTNTETNLSLGNMEILEQIKAEIFKMCREHKEYKFKDSINNKGTYKVKVSMPISHLSDTNKCSQSILSNMNVAYRKMVESDYNDVSVSVDDVKVDICKDTLILKNSANED